MIAMTTVIMKEVKGEEVEVENMVERKEKRRTWWRMVTLITK